MWKRQKVVVLGELQRTIIYTNKMSKQVTKSHARDAVHMYLVNWGAMLTHIITGPSHIILFLQARLIPFVAFILSDPLAHVHLRYSRFFQQGRHTNKCVSLPSFHCSGSMPGTDPLVCATKTLTHRYKTCEATKLIMYKTVSFAMLMCSLCSRGTIAMERPGLPRR
jgi:hypothetical protein